MRRFPLTTLLFAALLMAAPVATAQLQGVDRVRSNQDVEDELKALAEAHPDLVKVQGIGESVLGQTLWSAHVTNHDRDAPKLNVYLDGGHHGNEYMGTEMVMLYLYYLVDGWTSGDANVTTLLDTHNVYLTPLVNPDGNAMDQRKNARGVDLNRNYPYEWGGPGSGDYLAAPNYRGPEPLSEPETRANVAFAEGLDLDLWVTMHTGISEFYWPWGWTHDPSPDDALFTSLEAPFEEATNGRVDAMQAAELYLAAGATDDFGYGAFGVPTFTFEVHEDQTVPAYWGEDIDGQLAEQFMGLVWLVENTVSLGANVHVHDHDTAGFTWQGDDLTVWLHNKGWGAAHNVTVEVHAGAAAGGGNGSALATRTVTLAPDQKLNVTFPDVGANGAGDGNLTVTGAYGELAINTSEAKGFTYTVGGMPQAEPEGSLLPGFAPAAALAAALVAALGARGARRRF